MQMNHNAITELLKPRNCIFLCIFLTLIVHLPFFGLMPRSVHVWRQSHTLAVARNFYEESMNLFKPRIDGRKNKDGVTGMQFPFFEYNLAMIYKVFGFRQSFPRILNFFYFCLGIIGVYYLFLYFYKTYLGAALAAWTFTWSPELFYYSICALPDISALTFSVWGLYFFFRWFDDEKDIRFFYLSLIAISLGGLIKIQYLSVGFPIAVIVLRKAFQHKISKKTSILLTVFGIISVCLPISWYMYANYLIETSGLTDFGLHFKPAPDWEYAFKTVKKNISRDIPTFLLNFASSILFVFGIYIFIKKKRWKTNKWSLPLGIMSIGFLAYYIIQLESMRDHIYYMFPFLFVLIFPVYYGYLFLSIYLKKWRIYLIYSVVLLVPSLTVYTMSLERFVLDDLFTHLPKELYNRTSRIHLAECVKEKYNICVGPDESNCIFLYFLNKKGYSFANAQEMIKSGELDTLLKRNVQYLYLNDTNPDHLCLLEPYIKKEILREGNFAVFKLKKYTDRVKKE